jgi:hypothetical protein
MVGRWGGMKTRIALAAAAAMLAFMPRAVAAETPADVETDHIDAIDDGRPRSAAVVVDPIAMSLGQLGAEVDVAVGEIIAVSMAGDWTPRGAATVARAELGAAFFPQRFAFHGLYVRPWLECMSAAGDSPSGRAIGVGATVGYEWTWPFGATLRVGGGVSYAKVLEGEKGAMAMEGLAPRLDANIGWVF